MKSYDWTPIDLKIDSLPSRAGFEKALKEYLFILKAPGVALAEGILTIAPVQLETLLIFCEDRLSAFEINRLRLCLAPQP